jgi:tetratricopeptide (TPR) repeat protein
VLLGTVCAADPDLNLDPKKIINKSSSFLKEAEPEMTEEEYALYQKISIMLQAQPDFAIKLVEGMMADSPPPSPAFEFILGNAYFLAGQHDLAEARFLSALKRFPSFIRAWNNLGLLYYTTGRYADAIPCLAKSVSLGDRDPGTFGLLGYCEERGGNAVAAEMDYLQALAGDPQNTDWMEGLFRIYSEGHEYVRAQALIEDLIRIRPSEPRYWLADANNLLAEGRKQEALVMLEVARGAGLAGPDELNELADLYADQGLDEEAVGVYAKLAVLKPDLGEERMLRFARVLLESGKLKEADDALGRLPSDLTPSARLALLQTKADLFAARRQWPEARGELEELLHAAPLDGQALLSLGAAYLAENDVPRATFAFEAACRIPDSTYRASLELANIELKSRDYEKCAEYLRSALRISQTEAVDDMLSRVETFLEARSNSNP